MVVLKRKVRNQLLISGSNLQLFDLMEGLNGIKRLVNIYYRYSALSINVR